MKRTLTLLVLVGLLYPLIVSAQQKTITGTVTSPDGTPVPAASVQVAGTSTGTIADENGHFTISASQGDTLVISSLNYQSQKVVVGNDNSLTVQLASNNNQLQEMVVTALGIEKQKRSLGYSTTEVQGSDLTESRTVNLGDALSGRVAGVSVAGVATGPGGSSRVVIRGNASLGGNNQPLYVIDGIPYDNSNQGYAGQWGGVDYGDGLANINPDNIASIQVLKGVAASALYGYRGGNGAILITTKSGAHAQGIGITLNNNLTFKSVVDERDYQYVYGQGTNGIKPTTQEAAINSALSSWGPKIDGSQAVNFLGENYAYLPAKDNFENFYQTGISNQTTLGLTGSNDKGHFRLGLSNLYLGSVIPNANMKQQSVNFNGTFHVTPKLQVTLTTDYVLENVKNRPSFGDAPRNVVAITRYLANTFDITWMKDHLRNPDGTELLPAATNYFENPYFIAYEYENATKRNRLTGGLTLKYNLLDWLYIQGQVTRDGYILDQKYITPSGVQYTMSPGNLGGQITQREINYHELNGSFMVGVNKQLSQSFSLDAHIGGNTQDDITKSYGVNAVGPFTIPYFYSVNNVSTKPFAYTYSHYRVNSLYGSADVGFKNYLYLTVTARNDWYSTLNVNTNNYLYPSVSASFVFSDAFQLPSWITFGKLRASYAGASNGTSPYQNALTYGLQSYTINGQPVGYVNNSSIPNPNLKPVNIQEQEVGLNMQFLNSRLGIDVAFYNKTTTDDIVPVTISPTSGYPGNIINAGKLRNRGIEVLFTATPVKTTNFNWNFSLNFAKNNSKVLNLGGQNSLVIAGAIPRYGTEANISNVVGLPYGQIMGYAYKYNENGQMLIDSASGYPLRTDVIPLGSGVYKVTGGIKNNFSYKGFNLSFLLDGKFGANIYSQTNLVLYSFGLQKTTLQGREGGYVAKGVTGDGKSNAVNIDAQTYWTNMSTGPNHVTEEFIYDASFIKLRTLSLGYSLPENILRNTFIKGISFSLVGHNLLTLMKHTPNIDPESSLNNTNGQGLELAGYPAIRSMGFNLNVKF